MSDYLPPVRSPRDDRVRDTLNALRVEADGCGLSDPASVRGRGQARTRHQIAASVCAAVVAVAVVVTGGALLGGHADAHHRIIPATPTPSPSPHALGLAPDPFLQASDVPRIGVFTGFQRNPAGSVIGPAMLACLSSPESYGAADLREQRFFQDMDARFVEFVLRFDDPSTAEASVERLRQDFASCHKGNPKEVKTTDRGPTAVDGVSGSLRMSRMSEPTADSDVGYYEIAAVRSENVVVLLEWMSMGNPENDDVAGWAWTADRLNLAMQRATT